MSFPDAVGLAADLLTVAAVVLAVAFARRGWTRAILTASRRRSFRAAGAPRLRRRDVDSWVRGLLVGAPRTPAAELDWLAGRLGLSEEQALALAVEADVLRRLADGYRRHAARLGARALVGTATVPAVAEDARIAEATADLLELYAGGSATPTTRLTLGGDGGARIELLDLPSRREGILARDLAVSYRGERLAPETDGPPAPAPGARVRLLETTPTERERLRRTLSEGMLFDGVLPRLLDWRSERDGSSGRRRLHLVLGECTYGAVLLDHYPPAGQVPAGLRARGVGDDAREVTGGRVRLLTLSLMLHTADGRLLLTERSAAAGSHERRYGPSVNGNVEMASRRGLVADADELGLPDPLRAVCRESEEEIGVAIAPERVAVTGLARFDVPTERGTYVLTMLARTDLTAREVVAAVRHADPLEGRWEVGSHLLAVDVPTDDGDLDRLGRWLVGGDELTPHARAATLAALACLVDVDAALPRWAGAPSAARPRDLLERLAVP